MKLNLKGLICQITHFWQIRCWYGGRWSEFSESKQIGHRIRVSHVSSPKPYFAAIMNNQKRKINYISTRITVCCSCNTDEANRFFSKNCCQVFTNCLAYNLAATLNPCSQHSQITKISTDLCSSMFQYVPVCSSMFQYGSTPCSSNKNGFVLAVPQFREWN